MLHVFQISASGLTAQRLRLDIIADNIANAQTTRPADQTPYQRRYPVFAAGNPGDSMAAQLRHADDSFASVLRRFEDYRAHGVRVSAIREDDVTPGDLVYDPSHPHADEQGYVHMPNVKVAQEMVNLLSASRAYEANVTALNATKSMLAKSLEIGR